MNLLLSNHQCPGDILMLTACVRDLKHWYPETRVDVRTSCPELWENNPYLEPLRSADANLLHMEYPAVHESNQRRGVHFIHAFIEYLNDKLSLEVKLTDFKPDLHLTEEEKTKRLPDEPDEPFWVLVAGGKPDWRYKFAWPEYWQEIVNNLVGVKLVQSGGREGDHIHHNLKGKHVVNMVGKTSIRQLLGLIHRSVGVISHVTFQMHLAIALDRKAVTVAGGLEPPNWEWYGNTRHKYLHTIGELQCCESGGCWNLGKCWQLLDEKGRDIQIPKKEERKDKYNIPGRQKCFTLIEPAYVARCVREWHRN